MFVTPHGVLGSLIFEGVDRLSGNRRKLGQVLYWLVTMPVAFASHFLLDRIPHYDFIITYPSLAQGIVRVIIDILICWCILVGFTSNQSLVINIRDAKMFLAAFVAASPDIITHLNKLLNVPYTSGFVAFHDSIHTHIKVGPVIGWSTQVLVVLLCFWALTMLRKNKG